MRYMGKSKMKRWRIEIMAHPLHSFSFKFLLHRDLHTTPHAAAHVHGREEGGRKRERKRDGEREGVSEGRNFIQGVKERERNKE